MEERSSKIGNSDVHGLADVSQAQLASRVASIATHLEAIDALLAGAKPLANAARKTAARFRGAEEAAALSGVIAFAAMHPELFLALADEDEGVDPTRFETELLATRIANAQTLSALADLLERLHQKVADTALYTVSLVKPPALAAYEIAKPFQGRGLAGDELLNPAVNFYRGAAAKGAKTRASKKAATNATIEPEK
jgi:hypothetical protein